MKILPSSQINIVLTLAAHHADERLRAGQGRVEELLVGQEAEVADRAVALGDAVTHHALATLGQVLRAHGADEHSAELFTCKSGRSQSHVNDFTHYHSRLVYTCTCIPKIRYKLLCMCIYSVIICELASESQGQNTLATHPACS